MLSPFNLCSLPLVPMELVLKNIAPKELMTLIALLNYPVSRKIAGYEMIMEPDFGAISVDESLTEHWRQSDAVSEMLIRYNKLSKVFVGPLDRLFINPECAAQFVKTGGFPSRCREVELFSWEGGRHHQKAVDVLLEGMRMDSLFFNVDECCIRERHVFKIDILSIWSATWMSSRDLLSCDNRLFHLGKHRIDSSVINTYLRKWLAGGNEKLEVALFDGRHIPSWDLSVVLEGIDAKRFDIKNRDRIYFRKGCPVPEEINEKESRRLASLCTSEWLEQGVSLPNALDIQRPNGTWASVDLNRHTNQLRFFVWKDPRPSESLIRKLSNQCDELRVKIHRKFQYLERMEMSESKRATLSRDVQDMEDRLDKNYRLMHSLENQ